MTHDEPDGSENDSHDGCRIDRRTYLMATGGTAASLPLLTGKVSAATERHGLRFETVVDMVADAGCDPTGTEPCDAKLRAAADDYTLLKFPEGEYFFEKKNVVLDKENLGLLGDGDVRFTVPPHYNEKLVVIDYGTGLLFENIDIDLTAVGATPGLHLGAADDLVVRDVELVGQGIHPDSEPIESGRSVDDNPSVRIGLVPIVRSPSGTGVVENFVAHNRGLMGAYTRVGVWIGRSHKGTMTLRDCNVEGFPNNGLYCSRTNGVVQVEGGLFRNNDISQVRLGSEGSYVRRAIIEADLDEGRSPNPWNALNTRGVRLESGGPGDTTGAKVFDCDVTVASTPISGGGVVVASTHGGFAVRNTRIRTEVDGVHGIQAKEPDGGSYSVPPEPHMGTLRNVSITGTAADDAAIQIVSRNGTTIENCCLHQRGANRDGVQLIDTVDSSLQNSTVNVTGQVLVLDHSQAATSDNQTDGTCPVPRQVISSREPI